MLSIILLSWLFGASTNGSPVAVQHEARQDWYPNWARCNTCFLSSWTQGPECKTDAVLLSTISRIANPPASATSTYTPTQWCSDYLRHTQWSTARTTTSAVSTYTDISITHILVTTTDYDHPTATSYCPIPSSGMECGWDSNTIAPWEQGEDWSVERFINSTDCQQACLERPACKAYRLDDGKTGCEIFNVGLGRGASNVINPTPSGSQWWDRNCQKHAPTQCIKSALGAATPTPTTTEAAVLAAVRPRAAGIPSQPMITSAPESVPKAEPRDLQKRDAPLPPYLSDLSYFWSSIYVEPACSCMISSVLPEATATQTLTVTSWTSSTTLHSTYEDIFTVTETPRVTTIYTSIN